MKKCNRIKTRITWGFSPVARVVLSKKAYKRSRAKKLTRKEILLDG